MPVARFSGEADPERLLPEDYVYRDSPGGGKRERFWRSRNATVRTTHVGGQCRTVSPPGNYISAVRSSLRVPSSVSEQVRLWRSFPFVWAAVRGGGMGET